MGRMGNVGGSVSSPSRTSFPRFFPGPGAAISNAFEASRASNAKRHGCEHTSDAMLFPQGAEERHEVTQDVPTLRVCQSDWP